MTKKTKELLLEKIEEMQKENKKSKKQSSKQIQNNHSEIMDMLGVINDKLSGQSITEKEDVSKEKDRVAKFVEELENIIQYAKDNQRKEITMSFSLLSLMILKDDLKKIQENSVSPVENGVSPVEDVTQGNERLLEVEKFLSERS